MIIDQFNEFDEEFDNPEVLDCAYFSRTLKELAESGCDNPEEFLKFNAIAIRNYLDDLHSRGSATRNAERSGMKFIEEKARFMDGFEWNENIKERYSINLGSVPSARVIETSRRYVYKRCDITFNALEMVPSRRSEDEFLRRFYFDLFLSVMAVDEPNSEGRSYGVDNVLSELVNKSRKKHCQRLNPNAYKSWGLPQGLEDAYTNARRYSK